MKGLNLAPVPVGTVRLETRRIPASVGENLAQAALRAIQRDFTNPDIQADYQRWKRGIPLGFYISQWLANYILEPLDRLISETLGIRLSMRYMDDMTLFHQNKKTLHSAVREIRKMLGRRFRLKLKRTAQVCKFWYEGKKRTIGRPLDFMGFVFFRDRTVIRKHIMFKATRLAGRMRRAAEAGKKYFKRHISAMLSYMGWFNCTDTYNCYKERIKPYVSIRKLKHIISKIQRRKNRHDRMEKGALLQPT